MCHLYHFSFPSCAHISPLSPLPCLLLDPNPNLDPAPSTPSTITAPPSLTSSPSTITTLTTLRPPTRQPWNHPAHLNTPTPTPTPQTERLRAPTNNFRTPMPFRDTVLPVATHATSSHDLGFPGYPCPLCASRERVRGKGGEVGRLVGSRGVGAETVAVTPRERHSAEKGKVEGKDGAETRQTEGKVARWLQEEDKAEPCGVQDTVGASGEETHEYQASERMDAGVEAGRGVRGGGMRARGGSGLGFGAGAGRVRRQRYRSALWAQRALEGVERPERPERGGRWPGGRGRG